MRLAWPRSLVGRTVVVLLAGVLISNVIGVVVYTGERSRALAGARGRSIAEQVAEAADVIERTAPAGRRALLRDLRQPGLRLFWSTRPRAQDDDRVWPLQPIRAAFRDVVGGAEPERLRLALESPNASAAAVDHQESTAGRGPPWSRLPLSPDGAAGLSLLVGSWRLADGTWLNFVAPVFAPPPFWATPFFVVQLATTAVVLVVSVWAVRRAIHPLSLFADAAERLGIDVAAPPLREDGPLEMSRAVRAFNRMQERLRRFVDDRTRMVAAMSHDLRTPLTRLRLRAEFIEDEEQQRKMMNDLDEMQSMIDAVLAFARNESLRESSAVLDLAVLLQLVCEEAEDAGAVIRYSGPSHARFVGRPKSLKRAIANLIGNAVTWGRTTTVTLSVTSQAAVVDVADDGPGIPESELERVFEPFYRLDDSRRRETGGVGLGLAVVRDVAAAHGGTVVLANRSEGGLLATMTLPVGEILRHLAVPSVSDQSPLAKPATSR